MTDLREIPVTCPICDQVHSGDPYDCHNVRGLACQRTGCGQTIQFPVTVAGLGCFCSRHCAELEEIARAQTRTA